MPKNLNEIYILLACMTSLILFCLSLFASFIFSQKKSVAKFSLSWNFRNEDLKIRDRKIRWLNFLEKLFLILSIAFIIFFIALCVIFFLK